MYVCSIKMDLSCIRRSAKSADVYATICRGLLVCLHLHGISTTAHQSDQPAAAAAAAADPVLHATVLAAATCSVPGSGLISIWPPAQTLTISCQ